MDNKDLHDHLVDYLYGELDGQTREAYEKALQDAPEVREEIAAYERTREVFGSLDEVEVPSAISEMLLAEAARVAPKPREPSFLERLRRTLQLLVLHPAMSAAVVMVAVLGVSLYVYRHGAPPRTGHLQSDEEMLSARPAVTKLAGSVDKTSSMTRREEAKSMGEARKLARGELPSARQAASLDSVLGSGSKERRPKVASRHLGGKAPLGAAAPELSSGFKGAQSTRRRSRRYLGGVGKVTGARGASARPAPVRRAKRSRSYKTHDALDGVLADKGRAAPNAIARKPSKSVKKKQHTQAARAPADWLRRGHAAVAAGRCIEALDAYSHALAANASALEAIRAHIGPCRPTLARSGSAHTTLRYRLNALARRRAAQRKVRAKKRRSKKIRPNKADTSQIQGQQRK